MRVFGAVSAGLILALPLALAVGPARAQQDNNGLLPQARRFFTGQNAPGHNEYEQGRLNQQEQDQAHREYRREQYQVNQGYPPGRYRGNQGSPVPYTNGSIRGYGSGHYYYYPPGNPYDNGSHNQGYYPGR